MEMDCPAGLPSFNLGFLLKHLCENVVHLEAIEYWVTTHFELTPEASVTIVFNDPAR